MKSEKLQIRIDEMMDHVPQLPKDFREWVRKKALPNSKYIFYKKIGREIHGVCSVCGSKLHLEKATHNMPGKCSSCKSKVIFKAINKAKYYQDTEIVSIMQKMREDQYVVRYFKVKLVFKDGKGTESFPHVVLRTLHEPELSYWEGSREILTIQKNGGTRWESFEEAFDWKIGYDVWKKERKRCGYNNKELLRDSRPMIYRWNLKRLLKTTKWKYSGIEYFKGTHINIAEYLQVFEKYPIVEILSKEGAKRLLVEIVESYSHWGGIGGYIKIHEKFLGLSKKVFKRTIKLDVGTKGAEFIYILDELKYNITDKQILWALDKKHTETFTQMLRHTTANKIIKYMESQANDQKIGDVLITWRDYIDDCIALKLDLKKDYFMFPNNLKERHLEYNALVKVKVEVETDASITETCNVWKHLDYEDGEYKIVVARNQNMIIAEGSYLGHCVGGTRYTHAMAKGTAIILMLRKNNKPYSTIEFNPKTFQIVQNYGRGSKKVPGADEFANKWLKKHVEKLKKQSPQQHNQDTHVLPGMMNMSGGNYNERVAV